MKLTPRPSLLLLAAVLVACDTGPTASGGVGPGPSDPCDISALDIFDGGVAQDAILALTNPIMTAPGSRAASYIDPDDRVIGIALDGQAIAIPHSIGWFHEIVNLDVGDHQVAVTYCPLTGSSLVFDRASVGGAEFGVSGVLYQTNLVMYDRRERESFWPRMDRRARCGSATGTALEMIPAVEMTWGGWVELFPDTHVPADVPAQGQAFWDYSYPYGGYERLGNEEIWFPVLPLDRRRPLKERVLGISSGSGTMGPLGSGSALAFPFGALDAEGAVAAGEAIVDEATGSDWSSSGKAVSGPLAGSRLEQVKTSYVAFWFAWAGFHPEGEIAAAGSGPYVTSHAGARPGGTGRVDRGWGAADRARRIERFRIAESRAREARGGGGGDALPGLRGMFAVGGTRGPADLTICGPEFVDSAPTFRSSDPAPGVPRAAWPREGGSPRRS